MEDGSHEHPDPIYDIDLVLTSQINASHVPFAQRKLLRPQTKIQNDQKWLSGIFFYELLIYFRISSVSKLIILFSVIYRCKENYFIENTEIDPTKTEIKVNFTFQINSLITISNS